MEADKMLNKTVDIIKKYYKHSKKYPVLKYKSPQTLQKEVDLKIGKK